MSMSFIAWTVEVNITWYFEQTVVVCGKLLWSAPFVVLSLKGIEIIFLWNKLILIEQFNNTISEAVAYDAAYIRGAQIFQTFRSHSIYVPNNEDPQLLGWSHAQGFCTSGVHNSLTLQNLCSHIIFHVIALMSLTYVTVTYVWCLFGEIFLFTVCREQEILFLIDTECPVTNGWIYFLQFYVCWHLCPSFIVEVYCIAITFVVH